jgi:uncharacterized membrane protein
METTLESLLAPLIGEYSPSLQQITETTITEDDLGIHTTTTTSSVLIPDYNWIASAVLFIIALYSVFRMIGSMIGGKK